MSDKVVTKTLPGEIEFGTDAGAGNAAEELKALLLGPERQAIDALHERVGEITEKLEDPDVFSSVVSDVLNEAIFDLEDDERRRLVATLAQLMATPVKREIRNAEPQIMQALYPVADSLVKQGIRNAMDKMQANVNQRLREKMSFLDGTKLKARSIFSGKSQSELLLIDNPIYCVEDLILIDRQSGLVIAGVSKSIEAAQDEQFGEQSAMDQERLAGLLAALQVFAADALCSQAEDSQNAFDTVKRIETDNTELLVESAPAYTFAAKVSGDPPRHLEARFSESCSKFFARWVASLKEEPTPLSGVTQADLNLVLQEMMSELNENRKSAKGGTASKFVLLCLGIFISALLLWAAYAYWQAVRLENLRNAFSASSELASYALRVDRHKGRVRVRGIVRSNREREVAKDILIRSMSSSSYDLNLAVLEDTAEPADKK